MGDAETHRGGCLFGACRFEAQGAALDAAYRHCRMCQRSSGGPVQSWALFP
ncbi:MAG: hypothetical protein RQ752_04015 [Thermohalobaculum sp.]|nr:hypothetical protein [Thermohalobaculum sp.]